MSALLLPMLPSFRRYMPIGSASGSSPNGNTSYSVGFTLSLIHILGKFFTLNGDLDGEELVSELCLLLDSLFAEGNQINF